MYADSKRRDAGGTTKTAFLTRVDIINISTFSLGPLIENHLCVCRPTKRSSHRFVAGVGLSAQSSDPAPEWASSDLARRKSSHLDQG
jgi:hypothetical protein